MDAGPLQAHRRAVVGMLREVLAQGKAVTFTVRGDSMAPTLSDGDQVRIIPAGSGEQQLERIDGRLRALYPAAFLEVVATTQGQGNEPPDFLSWYAGQPVRV